MNRRAIIFMTASDLLTGAVLSPAAAQKASSWDGIWSGTWIPGGATSVTIIGGRVATVTAVFEVAPEIA